jgi:hypothetical protein
LIQHIAGFADISHIPLRQRAYFARWYSYFLGMPLTEQNVAALDPLSRAWAYRRQKKKPG